MTNVILPKAEIKIRCIVRDKHGHPKFDDPKRIKDYLDDLSEEDIQYLKEKYDGEDICN